MLEMSSVLGKLYALEGILPAPPYKTGLNAQIRNFTNTLNNPELKENLKAGKYREAKNGYIMGLSYGGFLFDTQQSELKQYDRGYRPKRHRTLRRQLLSLVLTLCEACYGNEDYDECETYCVKALESYGDERSAHGKLADLYCIILRIKLKEKKLDEAEGALAQARELDAGNPQLDALKIEVENLRKGLEVDVKVDHTLTMSHTPGVSGSLLPATQRLLDSVENNVQKEEVKDWYGEEVPLLTIVEDALESFVVHVSFVYNSKEIEFKYEQYEDLTTFVEPLKEAMEKNDEQLKTIEFRFLDHVVPLFMEIDDVFFLQHSDRYNRVKVYVNGKEYRVKENKRQIAHMC